MNCAVALLADIVLEKQAGSKAQRVDHLDWSKTRYAGRLQLAAHTMPTGSAACMDFCHKAGCLVDEEPDTHLELDSA
jgi:hypothetical protein